MRAAERADRRLSRFARRVLEAYRAQPADARVPATIVALIDANRGYADDDERCADLLVFLIAGHDTTAFSIACGCPLTRRCSVSPIRCRKPLGSFSAIAFHGSSVMPSL